MSYVRSVGAEEAERSIRQYLRNEEAREWARRETLVAKALKEWLPGPLCFLINHRRLLKLWIALPHRTRVLIRHFPDGQIEAVIVKGDEA